MNEFEIEHESHFSFPLQVCGKYPKDGGPLT